MVDIDSNPLYYAAAGGIILGIATSINYCLRGKVTGMSGIVYGISSMNIQQIPQKISIVGGMFLASGIFFDIFGYETNNNFTPFGQSDQIVVKTSYFGYALAGLLVGFGTKLGNGCTSGHGLCGLPRLSLRSFVAVMVFLSTAIAMQTLISYQGLGPFTDQNYNPTLSYNHQISANIFLILGVVLPLLGGIIRLKSSKNKQSSIAVTRDQSITFLVGFLFGCGLIVSGMCRRINILGFLMIHQGWNPSLLFVLGCGVGINLFTFNYMIRVRKQSFLGCKLFNPKNNTIDWKLLCGALCFGLGWGIGGLCPGPVIILFSVFTLQIGLVWFGCFVVGQFIASWLDKTTSKPLSAVNRVEQQIAVSLKNADIQSEGKIKVDKI